LFCLINVHLNLDKGFTNRGRATGRRVGGTRKHAPSVGESFVQEAPWSEEWT